MTWRSQEAGAVLLSHRSELECVCVSVCVCVCVCVCAPVCLSGSLYACVCLTCVGKFLFFLFLLFLSVCMSLCVLCLYYECTVSIYVSFVWPQEMAVRALKQTGSRNLEAALDYISKMGYLDPRNERIVHVIKQTSPGRSTLLLRSFL